MGLTYKVLGQINPLATTLSDLYNVPINTSTVCSTLSICNLSFTNTTFRVAIRPARALISKEHYIAYDATIEGSDTIFLTIGITLSEDDIVSVYAGNGNLTFSLFGIAEEGLRIQQTISNGGTPNEWERPGDWLELPTLTTGDQKLVGLYAVWNTDCNYVALTVEGNYTVNWGDGTVEDIASGVKAQHEFDYATLNTPVCSRGYKTVIINVFPRGGANMTSLMLDKSHSAITYSGVVSNWLDVSICGSYLTTITLGSLNDSSNRVGSIIERCVILDNNITSLSYLFGGCNFLQSVYIASTSNVTNTEGMFQECTSLTTVPLFNTSLVTNMASMFAFCPSLLTVPAFDTHLVTDMSYMFFVCSSLTTVPAFNTGLVTNMGGMFIGCSSLTSVPLFDTHLVTDTNSMFSDCSSLTSVPLFDTHLVTDMSFMFADCTLLTSVPLFDTHLVTSMELTFYFAVNLQYLPAFNCSSVTTFDDTFVSPGLLPLKYIGFINIKESLTITNSMLSSNALNTLFTNLGTVSGKTITITGNPGAGTCTQSIASGKGWTVVN